MRQEQRKIKFILTWYSIEKRKLNTRQRLDLLKKWIVSCVDYEEYEMAIALKRERNKVMKTRRIEINGKRKLKDKIKLILKIISRKIKRYF